MPKSTTPREPKTPSLTLYRLKTVGGYYNGQGRADAVGPVEKAFGFKDRDSAQARADSFNASGAGFEVEKFVLLKPVRKKAVRVGG